MGGMTHLLDENISGIDLIKIYNAQKNESNKFLNIINIIRQQRFKVDMASGINTSLVNALIGLSFSCCCFFIFNLFNECWRFFSFLYCNGNAS